MLVWVGEPSRLNGGWGWSSALLLKLLTPGGTHKSTRRCFLTRRAQSGTASIGQTFQVLNGSQHRVSRFNRALHRGRCCTFCCIFQVGDALGDLWTRSCAVLAHPTGQKQSTFAWPLWPGPPGDFVVGIPVLRVVAVERDLGEP